jgi:hypothetical protein
MTLALFIIGVTLLTLYGLAVSGHFPFELRTKKLQTPIGGFFIGATLLTSALTGIILIVVAFNALPWTAIIIGGGGALLAGPLLLRALPDDFVDGFAGILTFATAAIVIALLLLALQRLCLVGCSPSWELVPSG